jgi:hypothetical protein
MEQGPYKLVVAQVVKKISTFHEIRKFITMFKRAPYLYLFCARLIHSPLSHSVYLTLMSILSSILCPDLPNGIFSSGFPINTLCEFIFYIQSTCPAHLILLVLITQIVFVEGYRP